MQLKLLNLYKRLAINKRLAGGLGLSLFLHLSVVALLSHYGENFTSNRSVIEVDILIEGESLESVHISRTLTPSSPRKTAEIKTKQDESDIVNTKTEDKETKEVSASTSNLDDWEHLLNQSSNQPLRGRELDASERYVMDLRRALNQKKTYPPVAKRLKQKGKVIVRFVLREDGKLLKAEIVEASRHEVLNSAAQELIKDIDGLKPFPEELRNRKIWAFRLPVEYDL
jgi:TonB family protein